MNDLGRTSLILAISLICISPAGAVELKQETVEAFNHYISGVESRLESRFHGDHFLWFDEAPQLRQQVIRGGVIAQPVQGNGIISIRSGLIQDWIGGLFIPKTNLKDTLAAIQDYEGHRDVYKPDILDTKVLSRTGDDFLVFMRIIKAKFLLSDTLNTEHDIRFVNVDPNRVYSVSYSKRIAEVSEPGKPGEHELPVGQDRGFLWRLYGYWFFEERDGGVYVACESITLTRDVPAFLVKIFGPVVHDFPGEALRSSMEQTRKAVAAAQAGKP
jgi:hypothetical protein